MINRFEGQSGGDDDDDLYSGDYEEQIDEVSEEVQKAVSDCTDQFLIDKVEGGTNARVAYKGIVMGLLQSLVHWMMTYEMVNRSGMTIEAIADGEECRTPISDEVLEYVTEKMDEIES